MKALLTSTIHILCTTAIVATAFPAQALPSNCGTRFLFEGATYCVRTITGSSEGAVIEVVFEGKDDMGQVSTMYRQYRVMTSCRNPNAVSSFGFLSEHEVDDFGTVTFSNKQPEGTTISAKSGIGRVVQRAFQVTCAKG